MLLLFLCGEYVAGMGAIHSVAVFTRVFVVPAGLRRLVFADEVGVTFVLTRSGYVYETRLRNWETWRTNVLS